MGGLFGQLGVPNPAGETNADIAAQIAKLRGRSQAQSALGQLNVPLGDVNEDAIAALNQLSTRSRNYPGKSLVPYNPGDIVPFRSAMSPAQFGGGGGGLTPIQMQVAGTAGQPALPSGLGQRALTAGGGGLGPAGQIYGPPIGNLANQGMNAQSIASALGGEGGLPFRGAAVNLGSEAANAGGFLNALRSKAFLGPRVIGPSAAETGVGRFLAPGMLNAEGGLALRAGLMRSAGYAGAGIGAAQLANAIIPGNPHYQRTLSNAAVGAGIGAAIAAPTIIGTPIGALIGATIGAGTSLFGNKHGPDNDKSVEKFNTAVAQSNMSEQAKQNVLQTYNTLYQLADTKEQKQAAYEQASQMLLQSLQSDQQQQTDQQTMLASQAMLQNFLGPQVQNIVGSAQQQQGLLNQLAGRLPREFQGVALANAGQNVASANRIAAAYGNQLVSQPSLMAIQLANQRAAQAPAAANPTQALLQGG